jgi:hypothetical protein
MSNASTLESMSPELLKVVERAQREPEGRFHSLAHLLDVPALARAYHRMRKDAAVGVDGVTKEQYGQDLERNLRDLHARMKAKRYRHQPIRRVHIPKEGGKTRPIGISAFEDKLVQDAVREVLEAIYEQDFLGCSYGFRPGRRAHDAVRTLDRVVHQGKGNWILEADIVSFFDSLDRNQLPFSPLDRFVMELFRVISPNAGSLSMLQRRRDGFLAPLIAESSRRTPKRT